MIETDAPYLLPRTLRPRPASRRNEPAHLREILRVIAEATGRSETVIAEASTRNAARFFGLPDSGA
jgi:TatD DNase family protein